MGINEPKVIHSQLTTPDGTVLVSKRTHDFVSHTDENGKMYFIDGGSAYTRASCHGDEVFFTVNTNDPHEVIREYLRWGTYSEDGEGNLEFVLLKDMSTKHILTVLEKGIVGVDHAYYTPFKDELTLRRNAL